jgi:hypothetical protein
MGFSTPVARTLSLVGEILLWVIGVLYLLRTRVVRDERRRLGDADEAAADSAAPIGDHRDDDVIDISEPAQAVEEPSGRGRRRRARRRAEAEGVSIGAGPAGDVT